MLSWFTNMLQNNSSKSNKGKVYIESGLNVNNDEDYEANVDIEENYEMLMDNINA